MRVLETALTLNNEVTGSQASLDKAYAQIDRLKGINEKLKAAILNHEIKYEAHVKLLQDLNELRPQLEATTKENKRLTTRVKELEEIVALTDEETDAEKALETRKYLIARNCVLEQDVVDTFSYSFNTTVEQVKIINNRVELVIEGAGIFNQAVNGKIIYPPDNHSKEEWDGEDDGFQD